MDLPTINIDFALAEYFEPMLDSAIETMHAAIHSQFTDKEYDTIMGKRGARFSCSREYGRLGEVNNVLAFESRFGHDQAAAIDWLAVFTTLNQLFDVPGDLEAAAADFTEKLRQATPEQKVACYLKVMPKTAPAAV